MNPDNSQPEEVNPSIQKLEEDLQKLSQEAKVETPTVQPTDITSNLQNFNHEVPTKKPPLALAIFLLIITSLALAFYLFKDRFLGNTVNIPTSVATSSPVPTIDPTANWKTYTNTKHGFSFKYPSTWIIDTKGDNEEFNAQVKLRSGSSTIQIYANMDGLGGKGQDFQKTTQFNLDGYPLYKYKITQAYNNTWLIGLTDDLTNSLGVFRIMNKVYSITLVYPQSEDMKETESEFDQILSTFKFLDTSVNLSCSSINLGLSLILPSQNWTCKIDNIGKEQKGLNGTMALTSPVFTVQISSLGRGYPCDLSDPDPNSPRYDPTNACSIQSFYDKNNINLKVFKLSGETKEIFGTITNGPSISIVYNGMASRDLTQNEKSEIFKLLDSIKVK